MNNAEDVPPQPQPNQQKPIISFKALKPLMMLTTVLLIALVVGTGGYLLGTRTNQHTSQESTAVQVSPITDNTTTVIIQDGYFFKVTIPHEYVLIKGSGDYIRYVIDRGGEKIIGFYISSGMGEILNTEQIVMNQSQNALSENP